MVMIVFAFKSWKDIKETKKNHLAISKNEQWGMCINGQFLKPRAFSEAKEGDVIMKTKTGKKLYTLKMGKNKTVINDVLEEQQ